MPSIWRRISAILVARGTPPVWSPTRTTSSTPAVALDDLVRHAGQGALDVGRGQDLGVGHEHAPEGSRMTALAFGHCSSCRVSLTGLTSRSGVNLSARRGRSPGRLGPGGIPGGLGPCRPGPSQSGRRRREVGGDRRQDAVDEARPTRRSSTPWPARPPRRSRRPTGGPSGSSSSATARRSTMRSITAMRSSGQPDRGGGDAAVGLLPGGDRLLDEGAHVGVGRHREGVDDLRAGPRP